ncbi:MAG TPA: DNA alkylation repair protein [Cytophagales bacterium]|nr:DNA alkylation repair protein [Cytophagales bacterium]HAA18248.1 DNA alkylation repair protein [Cytophagales bacterium]HAP61080.1 DNA alkylation repair protein [Cytophagales bacterium]
MTEPEATAKALLAECQALESPEDRAAQANFGILAEKSLGVRMPILRQLAKPYKRQPALSEALWQLGYRETRILAALIGDPKQVTEEQMERWVLDVDSWDVCDNLMGALFEPSPFGYTKAHEWVQREEEFVKRSGFVLIAWLAVHRKKDPDEGFLDFLPLIEQHRQDHRNFVKKAVNWALRQIGKRSAFLHPHALACAQALTQDDDATARWIGNDAYRELNSEKVKQRLGLNPG